MKILVTGASGYIGSRLIPKLLDAGHEVVALARGEIKQPGVSIHRGDLLNEETLEGLAGDFDVAFYLVHSMGNRVEGFEDEEAKCANNFNEYVHAKQVIYLSGLASEEPTSEHMRSRHRVEEILKEGKAALTVFRAGIIIGSGSASFEIMRDLVEKLPIMIAPRWVQSMCQPISIRDVLYYLTHSIGNEQCFDQIFEIGGPETMRYVDMLLRFAKVRGLKRLIIKVPVLTPRLSSLWLYFVTSTNFALARALVDSLKTDAIVTDSRVHRILPHECLTFAQAIELIEKKR